VLAGSPWPLLGLLALPFAWPAMRIVRTAPLGRPLIAALEVTGRYHLLLGMLLAVGLTGADLAGPA
jgi:1,4-dihydroxy-2-naphthoate octaprenyltransferase